MTPVVAIRAKQRVKDLAFRCERTTLFRLEVKRCQLRHVCFEFTAPLESRDSPRDFNPLAKKVPSYVKDTNHFLSICRSIHKLSPTSILVTADVSALYTSILHEEGLAAIREALSMRSAQTPPTEVLVTLTRLILTNNIFEFDGKFYRQIQGTAMGTKMAPSYAILFMAQLENALLNYPKGPTRYFRYIDDCFMVYDHGETELHKFMEYLNSYHPTIKFTYECSKDTINFLDVQVTKTPNGDLATDLYTKPTDAHSYLYYTSCHPPHTKTSLPYSQAIRICRICTNTTDREKRLDDMRSHFLAREFPLDLINCSIDRALTNYAQPKLPPFHVLLS